LFNGAAHNCLSHCDGSGGEIPNARSINEGPVELLLGVAAGAARAVAWRAIQATQDFSFGAIASDLEELGGGIPRSQPTPKGATQFIFPNGTVLRFDLQEGQYLGRQGPHINIENAPKSQNPNIHIDLKP
jgi:hypothetical protein